MTERRPQAGTRVATAGPAARDGDLPPTRRGQSCGPFWATLRTATNLPGHPETAPSLWDQVEIVSCTGEG
jgi:hypothetical protein